MDKKRLKKYAELTVKVGANVQKGQGVIINASVDQEEFVALITEEAYRVGAKWVEVQWSSQNVTRLHQNYQTLEQLSKMPHWQEEKHKMMAEELPAMIHILSDDPDGLNGVDQEKMQKSNAARRKIVKKYRDAMENRHQWTIVAAPSKAWAKKVFPGLTCAKAKDQLWEAILQTVRVDKSNDPIEAWAEHNRNFQEKCKVLTEYDFDRLHYTSSNGTDFTVWLIPHARWIGGGETALNGVYYNPNMPTEEIFTSPMKGKAEGKLVSTKPLSYQGQLIEDFSITFEAGKAVEWEARKGEDVLGHMIQTDEGSAYLGELALVPYDSPISNVGILFYETLFDENASCHVALGRGFSMALDGFEAMTWEEATNKGINDSLIHVDFMIGSGDLSVDGYTREGKKVTVFHNGNWAL